MPGKKHPLQAPTISTLYTTPQAIQQTTIQQTKIKSSNISQPTQQKNINCSDRKTTLPPLAAHPSQAALSAPESRQVSLQTLKIDRGFSDWWGNWITGLWDPWGKALPAAPSLLCPENYPPSQPLQLQQHSVGKGSLAGVGSSQMTWYRKCQHWGKNL